MPRDVTVTVRVSKSTETLVEAAAQEENLSRSAWAAEALRARAVEQLTENEPGRDERPSQADEADGDDRGR